ncbi:MAG: glycosyltransferase [Cytophagaceae bacterium]
MSRFILPQWVRRHNFEYEDINNVPSDLLYKIKNGLKKFHTDNPVISIVIPAYNEEKNILRTLSSISEMETIYPTELIVSNNNSKDKTQYILDLLGVKSTFALNQGISYARQAGLEAAKGKYILNADSDSIYPSSWIDTLVNPLITDNSISCAYGTYSFIPSPESSRVWLGFYEMAAQSMFALKRKNRECVNVMGFNFAYRKEDAMAVGGFEHNLNRAVTGRSEDGWMALCLMKRGRLQIVPSEKARVWTSDRRLMMDGSLGKAFVNRARKEINRLGLYISNKGKVKKEDADIYSK